MQVVTRNELVFNAEDWERLSILMDDFAEMCSSQFCETCPLGDFCLENPGPADYLRRLHEFISQN